MDHSHDRRLLLWWPVGLGVLAYLIWSGRMGCGLETELKDSYIGREVCAVGGGMTPFGSTGNRAFDEYREETLAAARGGGERVSVLLAAASPRQGQGGVRPVHGRTARRGTDHLLTRARACERATNKEATPAKGAGFRSRAFFFASAFVGCAPSCYGTSKADPPPWSTNTMYRVRCRLMSLVILGAAFVSPAALARIRRSGETGGESAGLSRQRRSSSPAIA